MAHVKHMSLLIFVRMSLIRKTDLVPNSEHFADILRDAAVNV